MAPSSPHPVRNVLTNWGAFLFAVLANFFLAPFIVRSLGDAAYGAWVLLASMVGYLGLLDLGVRGAVTRFIARLHAMTDHAEASRFASAGLVVFGVSATLAIAAGIGFSIALNRLFEIPPALLPEARLAVVLCAITIALALITGLYGGVVIAMQRFDLASSADMAIEVLRILAVVLALRAGQGIVALAWIQLLCGALRLTISFVLSRRLYPELRIGIGGWTRSHLRQIIGFSAASTALHSAAVVILQMDAVIIGTFLSVSLITYFSIAGTLAHYGRAVVDGVSTTVTPHVSAQQGRGDMEGARRTALLSGKIASMVHLPIIVTFLLRGDTFIGLWMGQEYAAASGRVLWILSLAYWFMAGRQIIMTTLVGLNRHRALVPAAWAEAIVNVALSVALARRFGIEGVAWGTTLPSLLVTTAVYPVVFARAIGAPLPVIWRELWLRPSIAIVPFALATYAVDRLYPPGSLLLFFGQVIGIAAIAIAGDWWVALTRQERTALAARLPQRLRPLTTPT